MRVYNADGSESGACGNGTRCVARLIMEERGGTRALIETTAGILTVTAGIHGYTADMGMPRFGWDEIPLAGPADTLALDLALGPLEQPVALNLGNPARRVLRPRTPKPCRSPSSAPSSSITRCSPSARTSGWSRCAIRGPCACGSGSAAPA